jgi:hypothetical protein
MQLPWINFRAIEQPTTGKKKERMGIKAIDSGHFMLLQSPGQKKKH